MILHQDFFDISDYSHKVIFSQKEPVWTALDKLHMYLSDSFRESRPLSKVTGLVEKPIVIYNGAVRDDLEIVTTSTKNTVRAFLNNEPIENAAIILPGAYLFDDRIIIGKGTVIEPGVLIKGPVVIGNDTEIRQGAYIRGDCLIGNGCVVGHTTEIKGSIMLNGAKAGHFAYIGDSILGNDVNLGAGTKLANLRMIPGSIIVSVGRKHYNTGRRKLGAIIGDKSETGCNTVTSPGTLIGPHSIIYPGVSVPGGYYPDRTFFMPSKGSLKIHTLKR